LRNNKNNPTHPISCFKN